MRGDTPPRLRGLDARAGGRARLRRRSARPRRRAGRRRRSRTASTWRWCRSSSPLGIETLPPDEAGELLDAYHDGVLALPAPFGAWAAACLTEIDPAALRGELDRGSSGCSFRRRRCSTPPATTGRGRCSTCSRRPGRPLFIHPATGGPARGTAGAPTWWPAIVPYVQQMHAAWFAFRAYGRPRHPRLRVCFAILAGLAPLHGERFAARAGGRNLVDPDVFLEVSSYGTRAIDATIRVLGIDALVNGSDRPYADPVRLELGRGRGARGARRQRAPSSRPEGGLNDRGCRCLRVTSTGPSLQALVDELADEPERWREHVAFSDRGAALRLAVPRRVRGRVAAVLDAGRRHGLARPRHLLGRGAGGARRGQGVEPADRRRAGRPGRRSRRTRSRSAPSTSTGWPAQDEQAVSIHAYSPPLWRLGQYSVDGDGVMRRESVSYADELRPLEACRWRGVLRETRHDLLEGAVGVAVQLLGAQQLHRMRDVDHPVVGHAEQARLLERLVDERLGGHRGGGETATLELDHVVHTARRAGASVGQALHGQVAAVGDPAHDLGRGGLGEDLLDEARGLGAAGAQQLLDPVEELVAAALVDVEQGDPGALQAGGAGASGSATRRRSSNGLT